MGGRYVVMSRRVVSFLELPTSAAWQHRQARSGFEVAFLRSEPGGHRVEGQTVALEGDDAWVVRYEVELGPDWLTRSARVSGRSAAGTNERTLRSDGAGRWLVDGESAPLLGGCLDVDLEPSCLTNAFPIHRLELEIGEAADAPAAYIRALDLRVERLEQRYTRLEDDAGRQRYHYRAPAFDFECRLVYDQSGLLLDYPGIGTRVA
jgi:hypothetical protein